MDLIRESSVAWPGIWIAGSRPAALVAIREGVNHPAFGVAVALAFVVVLVANSLRRQVGRHAEEINCLNADIGDRQPVRKRMGHTRLEIAAGIAVGILSAWGIDLLYSLLA